jgi:predicted nucleic acid-binding protein
MNASISREAERLVLAYPLRAIDAIHVATALEHSRLATSQAIEFWTADVRQARAAEREGLFVTLIA